MNTELTKRMPRVGVGIATAGRRDQLRNTLAQLQYQTLAPHRVIVCPASIDDLDVNHMQSLHLNSEIVYGQRGLPSQRNAILRASADLDYLVFLDDDYYPADDFLEKTVRLFFDNPHVVAATGHVIVDGASGPGIAHSEALAILATDTANTAPQVHSNAQMNEVYNAYGCNMALRLAPVFKHRIEFDENLPLYGWLEDVDFCGRLRNHGHIVCTSQLRGVHLATKAGRTAGLRLGYSQIANPLYLARKGSYPVLMALGQMSRNVARNIVRSPKPEPWVDRRGRLKGNLLAFWHLISGRLHPTRILELKVTSR